MPSPSSSPAVTWTQFQWFVGFTVTVLTAIFAGMYLLMQSTIETHRHTLQYHMQLGGHQGAVRKSEYQIEKEYLQKELENIKGQLDRMNFKIESSKTALQKSTEDILGGLRSIHNQLPRHKESS